MIEIPKLLFEQHFTRGGESTEFFYTKESRYETSLPGDWRIDPIPDIGGDQIFLTLGVSIGVIRAGVKNFTEVKPVFYHYLPYIGNGEMTRRYRDLSNGKVYYQNNTFWFAVIYGSIYSKELDRLIPLQQEGCNTMSVITWKDDEIIDGTRTFRETLFTCDPTKVYRYNEAPDDLWFQNNDFLLPKLQLPE